MHNAILFGLLPFGALDAFVADVFQEHPRIGSELGGYVVECDGHLKNIEPFTGTLKSVKYRISVPQGCTLAATYHRRPAGMFSDRTPESDIQIQRRTKAAVYLHAVNKGKICKFTGAEKIIKRRGISGLGKPAY